MDSSFSIANEDEIVLLGERLAYTIRSGDTHYFVGDLGAGKTTLIRGIIQGLGFADTVTSPTYTLVEEYESASWRVFHLDLYRLEDIAELEAIGARDFFDGTTVCLVEWPEKGRGFLPRPTSTVALSYADPSRHVSIDPDPEFSARLLRST